MATVGGRLILLLASRDTQTAQQLATTSALSLAEVTRQLAHLMTDGFVVLASAPGTQPVVYRLSPKGPPAPPLEPHQRVLVVDDEAMLLDLMMVLLDEEGYGVVAAAAPADAAELLHHVTFDLVITDGFSPQPTLAFVTARAMLRAAAATPVAFFSAHRVDPDEARAAGFRAVMEKPFDLTELLTDLRALLRPVPEC